MPFLTTALTLTSAAFSFGTTLVLCDVIRDGIRAVVGIAKGQDVSFGD